MEKRLGEFIEKVKNDFNLRCCGTKHEDWHFYLNLNDCNEFHKTGFVSCKRHIKSEVASSEFIIYVLIEAIASVKFFKGINSSDNEDFYKFLISNGYENLSYDSFNEDLEQWLYTEDYQMFINGYYLSKYVKENIVNGELKMFAQFVKNDEFYSRIVEYFSGELVSSRGLRTYNNEYLSICSVPISEFTQNVLSYGYEKSKYVARVFSVKKSADCKEDKLEVVLKDKECTDACIDEDLDEVSYEAVVDEAKFNCEIKCDSIDYSEDIVDENQISLMELDGEIEVSDIELAFVDEINVLDNVDIESVAEESFVEETFIEELINEVGNDSESYEINEECSVEDGIIVEQYVTTILDDSDEIYLFKVRFTEEEMDLAETIINRSLKIFQIDLIENCNKFKVFTELSQYIVAANIVLGKILLLKDSPFDAIKMNMYEAESIKYVLSKSKIKEHDSSIRELYLKIENLFKYQTEIDIDKKDEYYKFIDGKSNSSVMKIMFENK